MQDLKSGIEHLKQAKAHMSKANGIMSNCISKLRELEEENAELKAELVEDAKKVLLEEMDDVIKRLKDKEAKETAE